MKTDKKTLILFLVLIQALMLTDTDCLFSMSIGDLFPVFSQTNTLDDGECDYLGIECDKDFSLNTLPYDVIVFEMLNVYCDTCRSQVEVYNDLILSIRNDPELNTKVCVVGIAVGNSFEEVLDFKEKFGAKYPIISDQQKEIYKLTGSIQDIPHTDILRKEGKRFVIDYHASGASSKERYLSMIKFVLRSKMSGVEPGNKAPDYSFISDGLVFDEKSFEGKRAILYFPVDKKYPLAMDIRKTENQVKTLYKILNKFPDLSVILFEYPGFSVDVQNIIKSYYFYIGKKAGKNPFAEFRSLDEPTVYYINEFGRIAFRGDAITLFNAQDIIEEQEYTLTPDMEEEDIIHLIEEHIIKSGKKVVSTEKFIMNNGKAIYVTTLFPRRSGEYLFSRMESSPSLCDVCHDSHFVYIIDQNGIIWDFIPVQLTKTGNLTWSEKDIRKVRGSVVGRSIFENFLFDPKVDAVTTATLTTSLVFAAFNQGKDIFRDFKYYKFQWEYWKQVCQRNYCNIKQKMEEINRDKKNFVINDATLKTVMSESELPGCPLHGMYLVLDGDIICSVFGSHTQGCKDKN